MKGDERRAEALAAYLEGGPLLDEIEELLPAVETLIAAVRGLQPPAIPTPSATPGSNRRGTEKQ